MESYSRRTDLGLTDYGLGVTEKGEPTNNPSGERGLLRSESEEGTPETSESAEIQ